MNAVIYHNPKCGTSRNTLAMIRAAGYEPEVVEYLKTGWTAAQLKALTGSMGVKPRDILRVRGTPAVELGLDQPGKSDSDIIAAMTANPVLVERPIVVTPKGARLCRPSETVLGLLERQPEGFTKEDGKVVTP